MSSFFRDLLLSARGLRRSPSFALTAVLALAVGIGATSTIFSLFDAAFLRPLPFPNAGRLVAISERPPRASRNTVSGPTYLDWRERNHVFENTGAFATTSRILTGEGVPLRLSAHQITGSYLAVLGLQPALGRWFSEKEEREPLALISHRMWVERFAGDRGVIDRSILLDGQKYTICGVMPTGFRTLGDPDVWIPVALDRQSFSRRSHIFRVVARMKPEVTLGQVTAEMDLLAAQIATTEPATNAGWGATVDPLHGFVAGPELPSNSIALSAAVGLLLLLSCVNVANLIMVRGVGRTREIAVRSALGASRSRILSQLFAENLLLAILGGVVGLWIAAVGIDIVPRFLPQGTIPAAIVLQLDARVIGFTLIASIVSAVLFGLAPAWTSSSVNPNSAMRSSGRGVTSTGKARNILASAEIALAVVLLTGAGVLARSLLQLEQADRGYEPGNVLTMRLSLPKTSYPNKDRAVEFYQAAEREITSLPGVRSAGFTVDLPLGGWNFGEAFEIAGKPVPNAARPFAHFQLTSPKYFETVGIRMAKGRAFDERDTAKSTPVCIVNEEFARRHFEGLDPIGGLINTIGETRQIVGVIRQVKVQGPGDANALELYVPYTQSESGTMALAVRTVGEPLASLTAVQAAISRVDKDLAVTQIRTLDAVAEDSIVQPRFRASLAMGFAIAALALAAIGVYGVLAFGVSQRVKEFGIRWALGATSSSLLGLVIREALQIAGAGLAVGLAIAALLTHSLDKFLFGVRPIDPVTFVVVPLVLTIVALIACAGPARKAMGVDPVTALRDE